MNQNMQNGMPPQWCGPQQPFPIAPQKPLSTHALNNGLGSAQSSRDSSPAARIPATQLPPALRPLPPTPHSSPRMPAFSTSTPVTQANFVEKRNDVCSTPATGSPLITSPVHATNFGPRPVPPALLSHASSTPALLQPGAPPALVPRPLSSGPQLQQPPQPQHLADGGYGSPGAKQQLLPQSSPGAYGPRPTAPMPQPQPQPQLQLQTQPQLQPQPQPPTSQYQSPSTASMQHRRYPQPNLYQPNAITAPPPASTYSHATSNFTQPPATFSQPQPAAFSPPTSNYTQAPPSQQPYKPPLATYPQSRNYQPNITQQMSNLSVSNMGFNKAWGFENFDLLQCPNILPPEPLEAPKIRLGQDYLDAANCSPDIFRCTMTKIPESNSLLQKSRLPLGVLIHPFKDLNHLPVIQCSTIVRCRACRTYINPFIFFVDSKRWKCNLCYRVNELPEEFQYDPVSKSYGDPSRRPEIKSSTIEYIAPSEYMLRPPQPAVYLYLLDISRLAVETGYLHKACEVLASQLASLPGDTRTQIGFLAYNSTLHFFSLAEGLSQPHEMIVSDIDDVFLPCPDNLLVNLKENMDLITDLLNQLPTRYQNSFDTGSALGSALQAAFKLMSGTGGRVTVFQTCLPTVGPGALTVREDPNQRAGKDVPHLNPATDFYKRLALDCSAHQVAVDLFIMNSQYVDIATLSGISRFSGGCMYHLPLFRASNAALAERFERCFRRYLTRKIGFEAVMRIRCTRGLAIHTFHGNFFVRSTDLLSLPNINPDAGFGMQVSIEESLADLHTVCFQAALLYTSSKGERRIRVHTLCLPVASTLSDILNSADQQCIVGLLAKMAVDRSLQSNLSDARDAFINAAIDVLSSYKLSLNMGNSPSGLLAPGNLKLLPLYILALLKYSAFRTGQSTRLDDRVFAMCEMKSLPLSQLLQQIYPDLYPLHQLSTSANIIDSEGVSVPQLPRLHLSARCIDSNGVYLVDAGELMLIFVCQNAPVPFLLHALGLPSYNSIPDQCHEIPKIDNEDNQRLHTFINSLNEDKPYPASILIIRENSPNRTLFIERLIEDRIESSLSYNEFLQHLKTQVK